MVVVPVLLIACIFAAAAVLGFGASDDRSRQEVQQKVAALLAGLPQQGNTLGSPDAPITIWMFADLECPTVQLFAESYLPSILDRWVRTGDVKLIYRSLQTDTINERVFFNHETAALAAGRQNKLWNFALTFVYEQGKHFSDYSDQRFLSEIALQVRGLDLLQWRRDHGDALLSQMVARDGYAANQAKLRSTPSFLVGVSNDGAEQNDPSSLRDEVEASLNAHIESLDEEAFKDAPVVGPFSSLNRG